VLPQTFIIAHLKKALWQNTLHLGDTSGLLLEPVGKHVVFDGIVGLSNNCDKQVKHDNHVNHLAQEQ
jgi:hypothetical protein